MGRPANLPLSWMYRTEKCYWSAPLTGSTLVVFAGVFLGYLHPALAGLPCGAQPESASVDVVTQIKGDAEGKANLILQAPASVDLRSLVTAKRRELRQKYANIDTSLLDHYLLWVTCQTIANDPALAASQKFEEYSKVYRLMSEPIKQGTPAAE